MFGRFGRFGRFEWLPAVLAAAALVAFALAFAYELLSYQTTVVGWAKSDLESRARLAADSLAEPLRTQNMRELQRLGDGFASNGMRMRVTGVHGGVGMIFDTHRDADEGYLFSSRHASGDHDVILGLPFSRVMAPFRRAVLGFVLAGLVGVAGVFLFFFVTYRQRVRIRELAKLEKFRREFIADVSHEIKTPLSGILGAVDLLGEESKSEVEVEQRKVLLSLIRKESKRLNGLVQSILDLARLERERDALNLAETDLGELVRGLAEKFKVKFRDVNVSSPQFLVRCDPQLVEQAVSNLIGNAVRHSGSEEISVTVECDARIARIAVEDHGIGIPPEHVERIFERFHRVDPARASETGGAGLGLSIVRRIAQLHGGDVVYSPVQPHGSRFALTILRI